MTPPSSDKGLRGEVADQSIPEVWSAGTARLVSSWRDGESRALAIAVMALRSIESREPVTHELTLAHEMAQSARDALTLIGEVMEP